MSNEQSFSLNPLFLDDFRDFLPFAVHAAALNSELKFEIQHSYIKFLTLSHALMFVRFRISAIPRPRSD